MTFHPLSKLANWRKLSIRSQLTLILTLIFSFMEAVSLATTYWYDIKERRSLAVDQATTLSRALNQDLLKALLNPQAASYSDLSFRLSAFESVTALGLLNQQGDIVYQYIRHGQTDFPADIASVGTDPIFTRDFLLMRKSLMAEDYEFGSMVYAIDLGHYHTQLKQNIFTLALFFPVLLLAGIMVAWWISRYFTNPVTKLAFAIENSDVHNNQFQKVNTNEENEIGILYNGYNQMIHEVEHSTRELRHAIDSKEKSDLANKAKSSFLSNMSHELRTPLNAILGYSEMIKEDAIAKHEDQIVTDVEKIHSSGKHLLSLINNLLDLSKIEANKMELSLSKVGVNNIISDVIASVSPLVAQKGNHVEISVNENMSDIVTDETRLRQILINLISNANKFTDDGRISIDVWEDNHIGEKCCFIQIKDSGIGISAEQLSRLFKPFTQANSNITNKYGGTGLGLVISKRFCELLGGDITVDSVLGKGSTFTVFFPSKPANI